MYLLIEYTGRALRQGRRCAIAAAIAVLGLLGFSPALPASDAQAATVVQNDGPDDEVPVATVTFRARPGVANRLTLNVAIGRSARPGYDPWFFFSFTDPAETMFVRGRCVRQGSVHRVRCQSFTGEPVVDPRVHLADRNDTARVNGTRFITEVGIPSRLRPDVTGADVYGGPGNDVISVGVNARAGGGLRVTIAQGASANGFLGGTGNDRLTGGAAPGDRLFGNSGDDYLNVAGGGSDRADCGVGFDTARVDRADRVIGCERVIRVG